MLQSLTMAALGLYGISPHCIVSLHGISSPRRLACAVSAARVSISPLCQLDDDEIDAMDTSDSWESQLAALTTWQEAQTELPDKKTEASADWTSAAVDWRIDEDAHLGLGDTGYDDDIGGVEDFKQKLVASQLLDQVRTAAAAGGTGTGGEDGSNKRVLTALEGVLNALNRLDRKIDLLLALRGDAVNVKRLQSNGASGGDDVAMIPASGQGADEWDGEVDESAYFDYNADDELLN